DRLRTADPLPRRHVLRGRVGLAREVRPPGRMAAVADDGGQPLAHAIAVPALGRGGVVPAAEARSRRLRLVAHRAARSAAVVWHGGGGATASMAAGGVKRSLFRRLWIIPAGVLQLRRVARGCLRRGPCRHHLEPPLVPAVPAHVLAGAGAAASAGRGQGGPGAGNALPRPARLAAAHAAGDPAGAVGLAADRALDPRPRQRLGEPRPLLQRVPVRLLAGQGRGRVGGAEAAAVEGAGRRGRDAGGAVPAVADGGFLLTRLAEGDRRSGHVRLPVDRAGRGPWLGTPRAQPSLPLAALRQRGGVPVVRAAPDPHRRRRVRPVATGVGSGVGTAAGAGDNDRRLPAAARIADPPHRMAAAFVWVEAASPGGRTGWSRAVRGGARRGMTRVGAPWAHPRRAGGTVPTPALPPPTIRSRRGAGTSRRLSSCSLR